jgi:competence protein ComEC
MENLIKINTREMGIFVFIGGFTFGVLLASFIYISTFISLFILLTALVIIVIEKIYKKLISKEIILITILLFSMGAGFLRYEYKNHRNINQNLETQVGQKILIEGLVMDEPERKDNVTRLIILPNQSREKILVSTDLYNHSNYGDIVNVSGKLQNPGIIKGDDGRDFDYAAYLSKDDIYYTISFAQVEIKSSGNGNIIKAELYKIKNKFIGKIRELFSEPESSLLAGLILAGKESLPKNILEEFRRAGIVHIVVLSGYNITIVAEFFLKIFSFLSLRIAALSAGGSIIIFTLMTGAQATVVRAALMALILLLGKIIGRGYSAPRALLVAGFLMLLENPKILVFDSSFKLSFLATLALMFAVPIVNNYFNWVTEKGGLRSIISTTIGTQVVVLPYILYTMGNFSVVALLSNVLTLIIIPITMLLGFIATLLGFINNFLALPFAFIAHLLLYWILFVGEMLSNLSWGSLEIKAFPVWVVLIWYAVYIGIYLHLKIRNIIQPRVLIDKP